MTAKGTAFATQIGDERLRTGEDATFSIPADSFTDASGTLSYLAFQPGGAPLPDWVVFDASSLTFSVRTPQNAEALAVLVEAQGSDGSAAAQAFHIYASVPAPVLAIQAPDQRIASEASFSFSLPAGSFVGSGQQQSPGESASMEGGAALPSWLSFNAATGTFSGTAPKGTGSLGVVVSASDGGGGGGGASAAEEFHVYYAPPAPWLAIQSPDQRYATSQAFSFSIASGTFGLGSEATLSASGPAGSGLPAWLSFDAATGTFSGTAPSQASVQTVVVTASNAQGAVAEAFHIYVASPRPVLAQQTADVRTPEGESFADIVLPDTFSDSSGQATLSATLENGAPLPDWLTFSSEPLQANGTTPRYLLEGTVPEGASPLGVVVTARDATTGASSAEEFHVYGTAPVSAAAGIQPWSEPADMQVAVGGLVGFSDLADADNTSALLATGRVSFYGHCMAMIGQTQGPPADNVLSSIQSVFSGTGPGVAEINVSSDPQTYYPNVIQHSYQAYGFLPDEANVNLTDFTDAGAFAQFQAMVDEGRSYGIQNFAPIFSPNDPDWPEASFLDPEWDYIRQDALYGGGLALDTPPNYYLGNQQQAAYESFTAQEIQWANANGLRSSVIISPNGSGDGFLADTQAFVTDLEERNAVPTQWVVENYDINQPSTYPNPLGSDTQPETIDGVALWVAQNAAVSTYTHAADASWTGSVATMPSGQVLYSVDRAGSVSHAGSGPVLSAGSGPDTMAIQLSGDSWQGNPQFSVDVDGVQVGGTMSVSAQRMFGQTEELDLDGTFSGAPHTVTFNLLDDAYGGSASLDRNLYVASATLDGTPLPQASLAIADATPQSFSVDPVPATIGLGSGPDKLALQVSGDAWQGDAEFTICVDGTQEGGVQYAAASHALGHVQEFDVMGTFAQGNHVAQIDFVNDGYGGPGMDRNLYLGSAQVDGTAVPGSALTMYSGGTYALDFKT